MADTQIDYGREYQRLTLALAGQLGAPTYDLFRQRMAHWVGLFEKQASALSAEADRARAAGFEPRFGFNVRKLKHMQARCLRARKLTYEAFDRTGQKRMQAIGELAIDVPWRPLKWKFYTGLVMSRNPRLNPALYVRLEPNDVDLPPNDNRRPGLFLLPDMAKLTDRWFLLEGSRQDIYAAAILAHSHLSDRPTCADVATELMRLLLAA